MFIIIYLNRSLSQFLLRRATDLQSFYNKRAEGYNYMLLFKKNKGHPNKNRSSVLLTCRKKRPNMGGPSVETEKTEASCHDKDFSMLNGRRCRAIVTSPYS